MNKAVGQMRISVAAFLSVALILSACGWRDSRVNPTNWFGKSKQVATEPADSNVNPLIPQKSGTGLLTRPKADDLRQPLQNVTELSVEPTTTGALVVVTGLAARIGAFNTTLKPANGNLEPEDGVLAFTFVVQYPDYATPVGTTAQRTVHEAFPLTNQDLSGVRVIRVSGVENSRESRRR